MARIAVLDYGVGNLRNVARALRHLGADAAVTSDAGEAMEADRLVMPGVGAFGDAMAGIKRLGFDRLVADAVRQGKPLLGICVGYQVLFEEGLEFGRHAGLGVFRGRVERFPAGIQVPHVGWNQVAWRANSPLAAGLPADSWFYFVHSFRPVGVPEDEILGSTDYAGPFAAAVGRGTVFGVQFHPEKSQRSGLKLLENFLAAPTAVPAP